MVLKSSSIAAALLLAMSTQSHAANADAFRTVGEPVVGQYIVVLKPHWAKLAHEAHAAQRVRDVARQMSGQHGARLLRSYDRALRGYVVRADDAALARLLADPRVDYVQEDGIARAVNSPPALVDPYVQHGAPWGLDRVDQRSMALNGQYQYWNGAAGVHAYVLDTGILPTHQEFTGRIGNGFSAIADGWGSSDCHGHGTHVAGTVGGSTYGVAKQVTLHPVRVLGCQGSGTWSEIIAGMDWVAANHVKPAVANLSLGGWGADAVDAAVSNLVASGVTVVAAAGNGGGDACYISPARAPLAITVGSTRADDGRSFFSNYGACVDLYAPGSSILSAYIGSTSASRLMGGTSMAAPHVAGAAALYLAGSPYATPDQVASTLRARATPAALGAAQSAQPLLYLYGDADPTSYPVGGTAPAVTSYRCTSGRSPTPGMIECSVAYTSDVHAVVIWPGPEEGTVYQQACTPGETVEPITVQVANRFGITSRTTTTLKCPSGLVQ